MGTGSRKKMSKKNYDCCREQKTVTIEKRTFFL